MGGNKKPTQLKFLIYYVPVATLRMGFLIYIEYAAAYPLNLKRKVAHPAGPVDLLFMHSIFQVSPPRKAYH